MLGMILYIKFLDDNKLLKLVISLFCSIYIGYKLNLTINFKKCPECYGDEFCRYFQSREIQLTWFGYFLSLINPNLTKNVFFGVFNGSEIIVLKRKRQSTENFYSKARSPDYFEFNPKRIQNLILCPGFTDLEFLFSEIKDDISNKKFWYNLEISIEPLLLKFFQAKGAWPVPKYYGACGEIIFEEYKGKPLINFLAADFKTRAYISACLLKIAQKFTFGHPDLIFYFTDYSLYNLVIDTNGNVSLVDLDNVIIFNRSAKAGNISVQGTIHTSQNFGEDYSFSPLDICSHNFSDHNYFSICKYLLSHPKEGLLNKIPEDLDSKTELLYLLGECVEPNKNSNRLIAGHKLQTLLEKIISYY